MATDSLIVFQHNTSKQTHNDFHTHKQIGAIWTIVIKNKHYKHKKCSFKMAKVTTTINYADGCRWSWSCYKRIASLIRRTNPTPYTLHPTPYTLHPTPYTLHPTPYTLHPTPYTLHPTPYTLHPTPYTLHPTPYTLHLVLALLQNQFLSATLSACLPLQFTVLIPSSI